MNFFSIKQTLKENLKLDFDFNGGKVIGSMCTTPPFIARYFFQKYIEKNIGDPGLCRGTANIEKLAIKFLGEILHNKNAEGVLTTGGSEANILAMLAAKKLANNNAREVILSEDAHFSFDKAALLMDLKLIKIPVDKNYGINIDLVKKSITKNTMAIVGIAGSTGIGAIDNIVELDKIATENKIYLHIDAAFGGFVLPFLESAGYKSYQFDFILPSVKSITIDPHKMGRGVTPGGCLLYRNTEIFDCNSIKVTYLAGGETKNRTIVGTRSGAAVIANWVSMMNLESRGYIKNVKKCMDTTFFLYEKLKQLDNIEIVKYPDINIIAIRHKNLSICDFVKSLKSKKWQVSIFKDYIRIVLMPHVTKKVICNLISDLGKIK